MMHEKEHIATAFNRAAWNYDANTGFQQSVGKQLINLLPNSSEGNLLDLGCGTGAHTLHLHNKFLPENIFSLDIAWNMLTKNSMVTHKFCADFDDMPFSDNSFSVVFSNMALQWSMDLSRTLSEMRRILKPEGKCIFSTLGALTFHELRSAWETIDGFSHCNNFLSEKEISQHLKNIGFNFHLNKEIKTLYFEDVFSICRHIKNYGGNRVFSRCKKTYTKTTFHKLGNAYEKVNAHSHAYPLTYEVFYVIAELSPDK